MSDVARLIEKFGLAIHGEEPEVVMSVLVTFVAELCDRWKIDPEQFAAGLREQLQGKN